MPTWTRLEPVPRDPTLVEGLQARIADPLWMLSRQWAFGEFAGEDAGAPVSARVRARVSALTRVRPEASGTSVGTKVTPNSLPLETLVEAAPKVDGDPGPLAAAQAGLHYLRLLQRTPGIGDLTRYLAGLLATYPFPAPPANATPAPGQPPSPHGSDPLLRAYTGRVPDGVALFRAIAKAGGGLPPAPTLGGAQASVVTQVIKAWYEFYQEVYVRYAGVPATWNPGRLEHAVTLAAPGPGGERAFTAAEYSSGNLDWHDFDLMPAGTTLGATDTDLPAGAPAGSIAFTALPTPVTYRGMPSARFWTLEDAAVDFGAITAAVEDVSTSLIVEFALRYGSDHYMIPLPLEIGSVCQVDSLVVTDTFGEAIIVRSSAAVDGDDGRFRLFEHTQQASGGGAMAREPLFVLFPTVPDVINGPPLEEVHYLRDEAADIVWAVERTAIGQEGVPIDRTQAELLRARASGPAGPAPSPSDGTSIPALRYILRSDVPGNWFPFLPPESGPVTSLTLGVVPMLDGRPTPMPWGEFLASQASGILPEEVTRTGNQAIRTWRYARWIDGRQLTWIGRRAGPGRGPGASGLQFDLAL